MQSFPAPQQSDSLGLMNQPRGRLPKNPSKCIDNCIKGNSHKERIGFLSISQCTWAINKKSYGIPLSYMYKVKKNELKKSQSGNLELLIFHSLRIKQ